MRIKYEYRATDGHQDKQFTSKQAAVSWARNASSIGSVIVSRKAPGGAWEMIARYRFGRQA